MIEVEELSKVYRGHDGRPVAALLGASFRVEPGQVFGLIGANGAGKTTTLRILSTVLSPSGGTARVCGFDVREAPHEVRSRIGFLSGSTGVYDRMTPREFIDYFGRLNGLDGPALDKRREDMVELLDMGSFADRLCGTLSTGQKQKASIARALIHDPPVLIFDEPTSGLDILVARAVIDFVARLKDDRRTMILSTHIMPEAERLCDAVAILHRGKVRAAGPLAELKAEAGVASVDELFYAVIDRADAEDAKGGA